MYSFAGGTLAESCKHKQNKYFRLVVFFHALYNVQLSDKYENLLKGGCWNYAYIILGQEDQYVGNWYNNATHIYNV